jgi:hypothetical protein
MTLFHIVSSLVTHEIWSPYMKRHSLHTSQHCFTYCTFVKKHTGYLALVVKVIRMGGTLDFNSIVALTLT